MEMRSLSSRVLSFSHSFSSRSYDKLQRTIAYPEQSQADELQRRWQRRCFVASVCCFLAIAATITLAVVFVLRARSSSSSSSASGEQQSPLSAGLAAIAAACNTTVFPDLCYQWLSADPAALRADPLQLASIGVKVALDHVNNASALASELRIASGDGGLAKQAIEDCAELMGFSRDQLNGSIASLNSMRLLSIKSSLSHVKVLLSGTMGLQLACAKSLAEAMAPSSRSLIESQDNVRKAVSISLGLVDTLSKLGSDLSSWKGTSPELHLRRLLSIVSAEEGHGNSGFSDEVDDDDGFPKWLSAGDRRLLQAAPPPAITAAQSPPAASTLPSTATSVPSPSPSPPPITAAAPSTGSSATSPSPPPPPITASPSPTAAPAGGAYNAIVAQDGSGTYDSINEALGNVPSSPSTRYTIYIKKGIYQEYIAVPTSMNFLTLVGDGIGQTIITGDKNSQQGITTYQTATVAVSGSNFIARRITFQNTAGPQGNQAVALRVNGDQAVFDSCSIEGYQDTLYALANRQFYTECSIYGTVDAIFGNAIAVFQNCNLFARRPLQNQSNTFTAQARQLSSDPSGYSFQECAVEAAPDLQASPYPVASYFGRPWQAYSRTVFLESVIGQLINAAGWVEWDATDPFTATVYYGEYSNTGPGADTANRVAWKGVHPNMSAAEAAYFTVDAFIAGSSWLPSSDVSFQTSL